MCEQERSDGSVRLKVQPDERIHGRMFPRPPIAEHIGDFPHDWLTAFENLERWQISVEGATDPRVLRSCYRPLFHESHVEITWNAMKAGKITLLPPEHLKLPDTWNAVDFWIAGIPNEWRAPAMDCTFTIRDRDGGVHRLDMGTRRPQAIDMFHRLVPTALRDALQGGSLQGIEIGVPEADSQSMLQLYALTFYTYRADPKYRRPAELPFPTHPDGVVPTVKDAARVEIKQAGEKQAVTSFDFQTEAGSSVRYRYRPETGTLADVSVSVDGEDWFRPCVGGGLVWEVNGDVLAPPYSKTEATLVSQRLAKNRLETRWEARVGAETVAYRLVFRPVRRSLVVEAAVEGSSAVELRIGYPDCGGSVRAIEVPMLTWDFWKPDPSTNDYDPPEVSSRKGGRARSPAVLVADGCFLSAIFDWYASEASFLYAAAEEKTEAAGFDGGAYYLPVIDQGRNPLREKLILSVSKDFHEVLPNIPNPPSAYVELMRDRVYSHGSSPQVSVRRHRNLGIHAVATLLCSYHSAADRGGYRRSLDAGCLDDWIDDPGRSAGGLQRIISKAREFREIGWLIGTYVNYCMMNAVYPCYAELAQVHDVDGFHRTLWPGTVIPATGEALSYLRRQASKLREKCGYQLAYDDQRTIFPIWRLTDYTPGVAGAGKFRETFEQGGQLYGERGRAYSGPILSEGGMHWMYSGLVDGNLARKQHLPGKGDDRSSKTTDPKEPYRSPADLVDFQLLKIHLLSVDNCGNNYFDAWDPDLRDRFISETLAYGKSGLWTAYSGSGQETQGMSCRAYYTYHLAQKRYRCVPVEQILYHNGKELVDSSAILREGKETMGRVFARYENGFESWVNLNPSESWVIDVDGEKWCLPAYGWYQRRAEQWGEFVNYSIIRPGEARRSRIEDEKVLLVGAPGGMTRWEDIETDGTVLVRREEEGHTRLINIDALTIRVKAERLKLRSSAAHAAFHSFDLEGDAVDNGTVAVEDGWLDFSFLAHEQFAVIMP